MLGPALPRLGTPIGIDLASNGGFDRVSSTWVGTLLH